MAIQSGDLGAFDQAIAAVDIAAWDLVSRRAGLPLWKVLGGDRPRSIPVYASAITEATIESVVDAARESGITAFKLKVGFEPEADRRALLSLVEATSGIKDARLMVDANQAWSLDQAKKMARIINPFNLTWIEEPISAEAPSQTWRAVKKAFSAPLAAGESIRGAEQWRKALRQGHIDVVQPDIIKWGGLSGVLEVARSAGEQGLRVCPHYLGGGVGLLATAHLCVKLNCETLLELDASENLFQAGLTELQIKDGALELAEKPGLGPPIQEETLRRFSTASS